MNEVFRVNGYIDYEGVDTDNMRLFTNLEAAEEYAEKLEAKDWYDEVDIVRMEIHATGDIEII